MTHSRCIKIDVLLNMEKGRKPSKRRVAGRHGKRGADAPDVIRFVKTFFLTVRIEKANEPLKR